MPRGTPGLCAIWLRRIAFVARDSDPAADHLTALSPIDSKFRQC